METNSEVYNLLKDKFDSCIILTMSNRQDRRDFMENQFKQLNWPTVKDSDFLHYHYATPFPFNALFANAINAAKIGLLTKPGEYDCARNHYSIVKTCYDLGFKHCLILEDDLRFIKDQELLKKFIENIPEDYDIMQFGGFSLNKDVFQVLDQYNEGKLWVKHPKICVWNASMYALSRKGMEFYLAFANKFFSVADMPLFKAPLNGKIVNTYISTIPLVIQADKDVITSDIRNKQNDNINYKTDNMYESRIDVNDYFE